MGSELHLLFSNYLGDGHPLCQERGRQEGYWIQCLPNGTRYEICSIGDLWITMHFQHLEFLPISQDDVGHVSFSAPVSNSSGKCAGLQQIVEGLSEAESFGRRVLGHEMTCCQMRGSWNSGTPWYPKLSSISIVFSSNHPATSRGSHDYGTRNRISSRFTEENFDCFMKTTNDCWTQLSKKHEIRGSFTFFFSERLED